MEKKAIGIGNSNFDKRIENGSYYVDKTLLVKDLLDEAAEVTLITRPRRWFCVQHRTQHHARRPARKHHRHVRRRLQIQQLHLIY
jgi:hypothetical protein